MSEIEKYAKQNFTQSMCIECGREGDEYEFSYTVHEAVTCWAPDHCSPAEYNTKCPDCGSGEDSIKCQEELFIELIGDNFEEDMDYEFYNVGENDAEEAYNPHIMVMCRGNDYVEQRIYLCAG